MDKVETTQRILCDTIREDMTDAEVLACMVVLHTHALVLRPDVVVEGLVSATPQVTLSPLTRTHVAELVAACFPSGSPRADAGYWFARHGRDTPYEVVDDVPTDELDAVLAARAALARHDLVADLVPE